MLSSSRPTMLNERDYICIYTEREREFERESFVFYAVSAIFHSEREKQRESNISNLYLYKVTIVYLI